ncbi:MAG: tRNA guanosine(34) transglycosylase Tgt [Candidatus Diapherotrites archaeon]|uniref:tRNA-guanosine(34) queuine transglycosylase n=1 Tax=Candidatus Iainarchaeum sp. TaxID=3101447 RepID=A0A8T4CBK0_9ARCH|nr:tRNA guanosine(34) transglycosylase Tgt [Candidatus Diapherotrites archaeon]
MTKSFSLTHSDEKSSARAGKLKLSHGEIETPFYMPVATKGSVKHLALSEVSDLGFRCMISNAFIFYLRPGLSTIKKAGGIHQFMTWKHNLFTDSGGFQLLDEVFLRERREEGVVLNNPFTKKSELFTPEKAIEVQNTLGSDVAMCLDDVPRYGEAQGKEFYAKTLTRTINWAARCEKAHENKKQLLFGINQGGTHLDLRIKGMRALNEMNFPGLALGGLAIGEPKPIMQKIITSCRKEMDEHKSMYVMGLGTPEDIIMAISSGADIFDSVFPTRTARHGLALTSKGRVSIKNNIFSKDFSPLDDECACFVCTTYSKALIHHLSKNNEESGFRFLSHHNLAFMQKTMETARTSIREGTFNVFARDFLKKYRV